MTNQLELGGPILQKRVSGYMTHRWLSHCLPSPNTRHLFLSIVILISFKEELVAFFVFRVFGES